MYSADGVYKPGEEGRWGRRLYKSVTNTGIVFAIVCLFVGGYSFRLRALGKALPLGLARLEVVTLAIWVLAIPSWFAYEYFRVFPKYGNPDLFEQFQYGQETAGKVWLAVATVLAGFYYGKMPDF